MFPNKRKNIETVGSDSPPGFANEHQNLAKVCQTFSAYGERGSECFWSLQNLIENFAVNPTHIPNLQGSQLSKLVQSNTTRELFMAVQY